MNNSSNISEVEILNSDDYILIERVCETLEKSNIQYIKTTSKSAKAGLNVNYNYIGKVIVSSENEEAAIRIVKDIIESNKTQINNQELPEELRNVDETYFEDLAKKGKITLYKKDDGTVIRKVLKSEFIKKLKEDKEEILKDRKIIRCLLVLIIPLVILEITKYFYRHINDFNVQNIRYGIILMGLIPVIFTETCINKKIKRMYKKYINKEEYKNSEKRINKVLIICTAIISVICLTYSLDWVYAVVTGNKPICSIKYKDEANYGAGYHSIFYDYVSFKNGRRIIKEKNKLILYNYELNYENGSKLELNRTEVIKDKIYIGLPSFLKEMTKNYKIEGTNTYILGSYGIQYKENNKLIGGCSFSCQTNNIELKNSEINNRLNMEIERIKRDYKENATINKAYVEKIDNKNIGVIEYNTKTRGTEDLIANYFDFFFEYKGKEIECSFATLYNESLNNNYLGEYILKTIEIYD